MDLLLRSHAGLLDDPKIFRTLVLNKILELGDRHRRDNGARRLKTRLYLRVFDNLVNLLV